MATEMNMSKQMGMSREMGMNGHGGHLYMQTNEIKNAIIHYHRSASGTLTEVERVASGGAGSGTFKPISGQESAPNSFEGAGSVILSPDRRFLFATNGGDNSVSSFAVGDHGKLRLIDTKPTGNAIEGKSGTAKSLAYFPWKDMLYVVHSFGPDHIRLMSVSSDGKLTPLQQVGYTLDYSRLFFSVFLRPPPACRIRCRSTSLANNSRRPRATVCTSNPRNFAIFRSPPCPTLCASSPAYRRRCCSSNKL
jgi:hypothetical protein